MRPKSLFGPVGGLSVHGQERAQVDALAVCVVRAGEHGVALAATPVWIVPELSHTRGERLRLVGRNTALLAGELRRTAERRDEHGYARRHPLEHRVGRELVVARRQQQHRRRGELASELLAVEPAEK